MVCQRGAIHRIGRTRVPLTRVAQLEIDEVLFFAFIPRLEELALPPPRWKLLFDKARWNFAAILH